jgi:hypothetical protein
VSDGPEIRSSSSTYRNRENKVVARAAVSTHNGNWRKDPIYRYETVYHEVGRFDMNGRRVSDTVSRKPYDGGETL